MQKVLLCERGKTSEVKLWIGEGGMSHVTVTFFGEDKENGGERVLETHDFIYGLLQNAMGTFTEYAEDIWAETGRNIWDEAENSHPLP